jgi:SAM-dependent methyltransferase
MTARDPWFVEAFRAEYLRVYPHRDLPSARREAEYLVAQGVRGRVLDLGCGFGRHTLALRERGVDAFGIDLSHDLLVHAQSLPGADTLRGRLVRADARRIPLEPASLDAVVVLFSSFGYFDEGGDRAVLSEIWRVSKPGARLVLDLMNPARVRSDLVPRSTKRSSGASLEERRSFEDGGRRVVKDVRFVPDSGEERRWRESVRMYEAAEIGDLLRAQGFALLGSHGGFDSSPFTAASERQIVRALRPSA